MKRKFTGFGIDDSGAPAVDFLAGVNLDEPPDLEMFVEDLVP